MNTAEQQIVLSQLLLINEGVASDLKEVQTEARESSHRKACPHCKSANVYKRGKQKGVQMYQCKECSKWYSETTVTPLWDIKKKEKWQHYLQCLQHRMSIKKTAKEVGISIQSSFDWRHKILSVLSSQEPEKLGAVVDCEEIELALSNKGDRNLKREPRKRGTDFKRNDGGKQNVTTVQVITAVDREGNKYLRAVKSKRLTGRQIKKAIGKKLDKDTTLITDERPSCKKFVKTKASVKDKTAKSNSEIFCPDLTV